MKFEGDLTSIMVTGDFFCDSNYHSFWPHSARKMAVVWMAVMVWPVEAEGWCWWDLWTPLPLPQAIFKVKKLKPIYICLASRDVFQRCPRGATQNANESERSFNGLVWSCCPKESFFGADTVACLQPRTAIQTLHVPRPSRMYWSRWVAQLTSTTWMHWN